MAELSVFHPHLRAALRALLVLLGCFAPAQGWVKGPYLTDPTIDCPPFVFLTLPLSGPQFGTDVQDQFSLGNPGRQLMFMARALSQPVLLFPRAVHRTQGLVDSPTLAGGAVHEPTVYHDARTGRYWVIFAYANDLASRNVARPCELYAMDRGCVQDTPWAREYSVALFGSRCRPPVSCNSIRGR